MALWGNAAGSLGRWQAYGEAYVVSETDTTATVRCDCYFHSIGYGFDVWGNGTATVAGQSANSGQVGCYSPTGGTVNQHLVTKDVTVTKGKDAQDVAVSVSVSLTGGFQNGTSTASGTVRVAGRTYYDFGAPSISAGKPSVGMGEKVVLSWAKSPTQGNANFDHFELYENGSKAYSGSGTSIERTPSDVPEVASVAYEVREVHEWYGTYPYKSASTSVKVVRLAKPNPPALTSPASGSVLDSGGSAALAWRHNPTDGTAQTAAEVGLSTDQRHWTVEGVEGAAQSLTVALAPYSGKTLYWRVRTKGGHADWSEWSGASYVQPRAKPTARLTVPAKLEAYPFRVSWEVTGGDGSQASAAVRFKSRTGTADKTYTVASQTSVEVQSGDMPLTQGEAVDVELSLTATTGLTCTASGSFAVDYLPPAKPALSVEVGREALSCLVRAFFGSDPAAAPTSSIDVYRGAKLIGTVDADGGAVSDPIPPLDVPVEYTAVARALSGSESRTAAGAVVRSRGAVAVNFGEGFGSAALVALDGKPSLSVEREKETFEAAAYDAPVALYGSHARASGGMSGTVVRGAGEYGTLAAFLDLMDWGRACVVRLPGTGRVYHADVTAEVGEYGGGRASVSIDWEETAHDGEL